MTKQEKINIIDTIADQFLELSDMGIFIGFDYDDSPYDVPNINIEKDYDRLISYEINHMHFNWMALTIKSNKKNIEEEGIEYLQKYLKGDIKSLQKRISKIGYNYNIKIKYANILAELSDNNDYFFKMFTDIPLHRSDKDSRRDSRKTYSKNIVSGREFFCPNDSVEVIKFKVQLEFERKRSLIKKFKEFFK